MTEEKREFPRYDIIAQIRVKRGRVTYLMDVNNISISGLFVNTESMTELPWLRVGQLLEISLFTTEDLENTSVTGEIVRVVITEKGQCCGFGVHFTEMDGKTRGKLEDLISKAESDPIRPPPLIMPSGDPRNDFSDRGEQG